MEIFAILAGLGLLFAAIDFFGDDDDTSEAARSSATDGPDDVQLTDGADVYSGRGGDDVINGGKGFDDIDGGPGNDTLFGGEGIDLLEGGTGDDTIYGGKWDDGLFGQSGDDTLSGDLGSDILVGGAGDDALNGGAADDVLLGGTGADTLDGGNGDDLLVGSQIFTKDPTVDLIKSDLRSGVLFLSDLNGFGLSGSSDTAVDIVDGGAGDDTLILGSNDIGTGGGGNDDFVLGDWIEPGTKAEITDFKTGEDLIFVSYPEGSPGIITVSPQSNGSVEVILDGKTIASVSGSFDPAGGLLADISSSPNPNLP